MFFIVSLAIFLVYFKALNPANVGGRSGESVQQEGRYCLFKKQVYSFCSCGLKLENLKQIQKLRKLKGKNKTPKLFFKS